MSKNHFVLHFLPFQINTTIFIFVKFFLQNGCRWPFSLSVAFLAISDQYATLFFKFTKWLSSAILYVRNSLWISFLAILDQYRFFIFLKYFYKMAAVGHFGCSKITFDLISGHFRSIHNFNFVLKFLTKWLASAILDVRNSLWITFLAILGKYRFFYFFYFFLQNGCRWPFWMSENHFRYHFYPFHIDTQL